MNELRKSALPAHEIALAAVRSELHKAMAKHAPMNSAHEAYSVILEELDEFWDQVKLKREKRSRAAMRQELIQVAAMAARAIIDLNLVTVDESERSQ